MRTTFRARQPYADKFLNIAEKFPCSSPVKPERFIKKMLMNQGSTAGISGMGLDEAGLERKNPVIVALGDSVTAGHFEMCLPTDPEEVKAMMAKAFGAKQPTAEELAAMSVEELMAVRRPAIEITDARESYIEKFRMKLIDKYETTSVSVINAGIAGDVLTQMAARADRDVIRYQPDLVLINGSLNWGPGLGTAAEYKEILRGLVQRIKNETEADIILLTPNGDLPNALFGDPNPPLPTTPERVAMIRELAVEEQVCLADTYAVWEAARDAGIPWKELLANGVNHPGVEGHEVYAITLMKLFE